MAQRRDGRRGTAGPAGFALSNAHTEVLRLVEYIDQDIATWLGQTSRVPELLRARP
ncbi:hypothetical protein V1J52_24325 [Streptomyces sp. TRM 70351]|uniref:hypothetical protein n=1 Tax=Streptomyces sp. TRM 70351 TaxID=3116552 RepID=UPI002E7BBD37|nr:hypothetical protein [Streptomyces sp. TRM 70351]MEE1931264.1 hypothetical protein [Streptomyces sp. TRM 70351]